MDTPSHLSGTDPLPQVVAAVSNRMVEIVGFFKPGVKIAVMVRTPGHPTRDFMLTDDKIPELRAMLDRRERPARWVAATILPPVKKGRQEFFTLCVERAHSGKRYAFEAAYLNDYPIDFEDGCPHGDQLAHGAHAEGCLTTGWFTDTGEHWEPIHLEGGDRLIAWQEKPEPPTDGEISQEARS